MGILDHAGPRHLPGLPQHHSGAVPGVPAGPLCVEHYPGDGGAGLVLHRPAGLRQHPLGEGKGICGGYTDAMALFLDKMGITNYKIASENHIWNLVYIDGSWKHLDLTWDDPVSTDGTDYLQHKYFLITTKQLKEADSGDVIVVEHNFKDSIYRELKEKTE